MFSGPETHPRMKLSRSCLRLWIQGGCSTKSAVYQKGIASITSLVSKGTEAKWQPLHYMLTHKYGPRELKARVFAGTIQIRRCPQDTRFPEFKEITAFETNSMTKKVSAQCSTDPSKVSWGDFDMLQNLDMKADSLRLTKELG